jgi:predicted Zn finger-like uncharacterized protein
MILTCPNCSSRYHVDGATFGPQGRKVKCANCGERWLAKPPADAPTVVVMPAPPPPPTFRRTRAAAATAATTPPAAAPDRSTGWVGWGLGSVFVVLLLLSAIMGRNEIVAGFPASASIYQTLGLPVDVELGLEFADVKSDWLVEGGASVLVVEGQIVNLSQQERTIPRVRMAILDADGRELQYEYLDVSPEPIAAGTRAGFSGRLVNPAERGQNFRLSFELDS